MLDLDQSVYPWIATCPKGLEQLLAEELQQLNLQDVRQTVAAVTFTGSLSDAYRVCLWSRLANRLLFPLVNRKADNADELYRLALSVPWSKFFDVGKTFAVDFNGTSKGITHSTFGAQRVKDGIVDHFRDATGVRPDVDLEQPAVRVQVRLHKGEANIALDFSGVSLHRRGYRVGQGTAPLKENLAAALLLRSDWPKIAAAGGALLDPMCGSGTLLIEGAMLAADIAPGLRREDSVYSFQHLKFHDAELWEEHLSEAKRTAESGLAKLDLSIQGYEANPRMIEIARDNVVAAGLDEHIRVTLKPLAQFGKPTAKTGLLLSNPPYGERLGDKESLTPIYQLLGRTLQKNFNGWRAAIFTGNPDLARAMDLSPTKQYKLYNGSIECKLLVFDDLQSKSEKIAQRLSTPPPEQPLSDGARMLLNRLQKNQRRLTKWLQESGVSCYRLYDADIPEYAVAVDVYEQSLHVQEYAPPASVDSSKAQQHLAEVRMALKAFAPFAQLFFKQRKKQKGQDQYQKTQVGRSKIQIVREGPAKFEVNLTDYLDTGLFLDHRPVRRLIREMAEGKRFLNLFCYTATASVQAALGGAIKTLSIDLSNTYLDWARRNFELNKLDDKRNPLMRANCIEWLERGIGEFDLVLLDPPTFSNSKKMRDVLEIQRDHAEMIRATMRKVAPGGTLIFSNNFRKFKMDASVFDEFEVEQITSQTVDPDFQRDSRIHNVWKIAGRARTDSQKHKRQTGTLKLNTTSVYPKKA